MVKKISRIFFMFLFGLTLSFGSPRRISADAGFDNDYDSSYDSGYDSGWGGSSGGSSWRDDDDSNSNYNYSGEPLSGTALFIVILSVVVMVSIPISIQLNSEKRARRKRNPLIDTYGLEVDDELNSLAFDIYEKINVAWMNKDLEPVRHLMTDDMYNMYLMQLDTLIESEQTNIMKNIRFVSGHVYSRRKYKGVETIVMIFRVTCKDYIVDKDGWVVRGKRFMTHDYTYELKFVRNITSDRLICPSCGHELDIHDGVVCPHCETIIHDNVSSLRLSSKRMLRQSRKGE